MTGYPAFHYGSINGWHNQLFRAIWDHLQKAAMAWVLIV
jgi:hypothetical protein